MNLESQHRSLTRFISICAYIFGLGWLIGGIILFGGNIILHEAQQALNLVDGKPESAVDYHLGMAWWMMWAGYFIFIFSDFCFIFVILGITYLYCKNDLRMWAISLAVLIWMTIALGVDCFLVSASWIVGPKSEMGLDPHTIGTVFENYDKYVNNVIRWPVRGMYLFVGSSLLFLGRIAKDYPWPKKVRSASLFFGTAMGIEVLTFVITVVFGKSPIQLPAYCLMFFVAAPTWGIVIGNALRHNKFMPAQVG